MEWRLVEYATGRSLYTAGCQLLPYLSNSIQYHAKLCAPARMTFAWLSSPHVNHTSTLKRWLVVDILIHYHVRNSERRELIEPADPTSFTYNTTTPAICMIHMFSHRLADDCRIFASIGAKLHYKGTFPNRSIHVFHKRKNWSAFGGILFDIWERQRHSILLW